LIDFERLIPEPTRKRQKRKGGGEEVQELQEFRSCRMAISGKLQQTEGSRDGKRQRDLNRRKQRKLRPRRFCFAKFFFRVLRLSDAAHPKRRLVREFISFPFHHENQSS
jgi:hypothetical protein